MRLRWVVLGFFVLSSALNYLDRQILPALEPALKDDFRLSNADYGLILSAFSVAYAIAAPLAGLFIDRLGLNRGISLAVGFWSLAGIATAFANGLGGLFGCRAWLGVAQAGGVPATGKAIASYLRPEERALGNAVSQIGLGAGAMLAPPLAVWMATRYGSWRWPFLVTGLLTLLWIPLWNWIARAAPKTEFPSARPGLRPSEVFRDRQLWAFIAANVLSMTVYTLWSNWTTVYLVQERGLRLAATASLAWWPPLFFNLGGLAGGWLSMRWIRAGTAPLAARLRACLLSAVALVATAVVPLMPSAGWAIAAICLSAFWSSSMSVNLYTMPLDVYGAARAAFAVSMLTSAYGAMQAVFSPLAGKMIDHYGFQPVCLLVAVLPLLGWGVLYLADRDREDAR
jgi:ACS family hexuronate transporter-like MFS transporter